MNVERRTWGIISPQVVGEVDENGGGEMEKTRVLFVCVHNSARSQMAEAFLNTLAGDRFHAESAGMEPGVLNSLAVEVMREVGIDISGRETKSVFDKFKRGELYSYVVTVCDEASAEVCPVFPGLRTRTLHWSFEDPASFTGSSEDRLEKTRGIRDAIRRKVVEFIEEVEK